MRDAFESAWSVLKMSGSMQAAMTHDLARYMEGERNQKTKTRNDARKTKSKAQKLRDKGQDHMEDADVIRYYKENHPEFFHSFMNGSGEQ